MNDNLNSVPQATPMRSAQGMQNIELPTPSSTSKLEKIQPVDDNNMLFSASQPKKAQVLESKPSRYQGARPESSMGSSDVYSAYSDKFDSGAKNASPNKKGA